MLEEGNHNNVSPPSTWLQSVPSKMLEADVKLGFVKPAVYVRAAGDGGENGSRFE
jgi:hypothetical protein